MPARAITAPVDPDFYQKQELLRLLRAAKVFCEKTIQATERTINLAEQFEK